MSQIPLDMDSPAARALAGPSRRTRSQLRQARTSTGKPYARPSLGATSSSEQLTPRKSESTPTRLRNGDVSVSVDRSPASDAKAAPAAAPYGGILSGLRQAIFSRPLSWLQRGAPKSSTLASSSSTSSLASAHQKAAAQRLSLSKQAPKSSAEATSSSSRPSGFLTPGPATPSRSPFAASVALPSRGNQFGFVNSNSAAAAQRAASPSGSSARDMIQSYGMQRLTSVEPPTSPRHSVASGSALGTPGYLRATSLRPDGSASGVSKAQSHTSFSYGYGSERRLGGLTSSTSLQHGGSYSHSPLAASPRRPLPSRSPFALQPRRSLGTALSAAGSEYGGSRIPGSPRSTAGFGLASTPLRPASAYGSMDGRHHHAATSVAGNSRASSRTNTPKRREWGKLNIAPPSGQKSEGEELMREYLAMCNQTASPNPSHPILDSLLMRGSAPPADVMERSVDSDLSKGGLKRMADVSMDEDGLSSVQSMPRKKRMVWDSQLGFVSAEEQRNFHNPKPVASNEAERLLNALEGMRTPIGDARRDGSARSTTPLQSVHVPLSSNAAYDSAAHMDREYVNPISPYSRALRHSRMSQSVEPEPPGLRSRLQRSHVPESSMGDMDERTSADMEEEMSIGATSQDGKNGDEDDDDIVEPPRKRLVERQKAPVKTAKESKAVAQEKEEVGDLTQRVLRSGKTVPLPTTSPKRTTKPLQSSPVSAAKPMSKARIGISASGASAFSRQQAERQGLPAPATSAQPKDAFSVRSSVDAGANPRARSSLRQGAEKTHRSHQRSGRIALDDDADEDDDSVTDLPNASDLEKIKLPTNLFPQGFDFSKPSTKETAAGAPQASSGAAFSFSTTPIAQADAGTAKDTSSEAGSSLLSRMGGFAPPPPEQVPAPSTSSSDAPSKPTFSFTAPSSDGTPAPTSKPLFSFQPTVSSPLASSNGANAGEKAATSAPNFFSAAPAAVEKKDDSTNADKKNDGPVPNFFASSLAKPGQGQEAAKPSFSFSAPSNAAKGATTQSTPATNGFTFNAPPSAASTDAEKSSKPTFSFGAPPQDTAVKEAAAKPSFSFGSTPASQPATAPSFAFGATQNGSTSTPAPSFTGFGAASSAPKRGMDEEGSSDEPKAKKMFESKTSTTGAAQPFSFGNNASSSTSAPKPAFQFNAPPSQPEAKSGTPAFSFGSTSTAEEKAKAPAPFAFGAPSAAAGEAEAPATAFTGFGSAANASQDGAAPKPAFSFGTSGTTSPAPQASGFTFGSKPASPQSAGSQAPAFSFGQAAQQSSTPTSPFAFGAQQASQAGTASALGSQDSSRHGSPAPFTFGAPASQQSSQNTATSVGFGQQPGTPTGPAFTFGAAAQPNAPGVSNGFGASSVPMGASTSTPGFGGAQPASGSPFVFGAPQTAGPAGMSSAASSAGGGGGFTFGAPTMSPTASFAGVQTPASPAQSTPLFNIGAPSSSPASGGGGNRPVRGMPNRRRKA